MFTHCVWFTYSWWACEFAHHGIS